MVTEEIQIGSRVGTQAKWLARHNVREVPSADEYTRIEGHARSLFCSAAVKEGTTSVNLQRCGGSGNAARHLQNLRPQENRRQAHVLLAEHIVERPVHDFLVPRMSLGKRNRASDAPRYFAARFADPARG